MANNSQHTFKALWEIFLVSSRLGFTSFGGPIAHLGYFHDEYVRRRKWLNEQHYADLVALCQFLPGPASSQVGIGIGLLRGGFLGGIISFIGFTFPSVLVLMIFALFLQTSGLNDTGWINGLKLVAVAVVAHAIIGMAKNLTPDTTRKTIALLAVILTVLWQTAYTQVGVIFIAGTLGFFLYRKEVTDINKDESSFPLSKRLGIVCLTLFFVLLFVLPILREVTSYNWIAIADSFYRSGSLVFGGGHVVLPLLEREFVPTGWISEEHFLTGYGATQAVPGPLFTFAAYLGTVIAGWQGGLLATAAIFLPAFLLIIGTLPFWNELRKNPHMKAALMGINAAVVGILISAFYEPIWTSAIVTAYDFAFAALLFSMLAYWKLPAWTVVLAGACGGFLIAII